MAGEKTIPLACTPDAIPAAEREPHLAHAHALLTRATERIEEADGLTLRYEADDLLPVARFVENERRCCPFLRFSIDLEPAGGALRLRMQGPPGTREILEAGLRD
jgi:hypothetical protein